MLTFIPYDYLFLVNFYYLFFFISHEISKIKICIFEFLLGINETHRLYGRFIWN